MGASMVAQKRICLQCKRPGFCPSAEKIPWRREWLPTPVFLPREFHEQRGVAGYSPCGHKESDMTERLILLHFHPKTWGFPGGSVIKNLPANAGDASDVSSVPESGRVTGRGNGNLFQYSCLENFMERGAWKVTVHGVAKSQTRLSD